MEKETIKKIAVQIALTLSGLALILAVGYGSAWYAEAIDLFALEKVVVNGTTIISEDTVFELADIPFGISLFDLPLDSIQAEVAQNPFVLAAQVSRQFPRTLFIQVFERKPLAYVHADRFYCIDHNGYVMPEPPVGMSLPVPILSGFTREDTIRTGEFSSNFKLIHMIEILRKIRQEYPGLYSETSELVSTQNDFILYTSDSATRIYLGNNDFSIKVDLLEVFWETIGDRRTWADYEYIDLRYKKQVIVRERT